MRRALLVLLVCAAACHQPWRDTPPVVANQIAVRIPAYEHRSMSNGVQVYLQPDEYLPLVSLHLVVRAGDAAVPQQQSGVMRLLYEMMLADAELAHELDNLGAAVELEVQADAAYISLNVSSTDALAALKLLVNAVREPHFDEATFTRVRTRLLAAVFGQTPLPIRRAEDALLARIYGPAHPLALTGRKTLTPLSQLRLDDVTAAYKRFIGPKNVALVMAGRVPKVVGFAWAQKYLGDWSVEVEEPKVAPPLLPAGRRMIPLLPVAGLPGTAVLFGGRLQWKGLAEEATARAAIRQLGRQISVVLQLRGYAVPGTEIETAVDHYGFGAHYVLRAIIRPEFTKVALEEILRQSSSQIVLQVSADADRVTAVAQILYQLRLYDSIFHTSRLTGVASIVHSFRGLSNIGRNAARLFVLRQPDVYYIQLIEYLNALTAKQIDHAIAFHFVPDVAQLVLAGDPQLIESQLRGTDLGTLQRVLPD